MGDKTKIDWCDASWNPVAGCLHGCTYCYAQRMVKRFTPKNSYTLTELFNYGNHIDVFKSERTGSQVCVLNKPFKVPRITLPGQPDETITEPYPTGFYPTYHRYRLDIPRKWEKPKTIFVCSMADLFGEWVPDYWIEEIIDACRDAPQHRYLFLTKNPKRYDELVNKGIITGRDDNFWFGSTVTDLRTDPFFHSGFHTFLSCEPMLAPWPPADYPNPYFTFQTGLPQWFIFGAETGNSPFKIIPKKEWVMNAARICRNIGAKVFMKESLREIMGADFIQEFPWDN